MFHSRPRACTRNDHELWLWLNCELWWASEPLNQHVCSYAWFNVYYTQARNIWTHTLTSHSIQNWITLNKVEQRTFWNSFWLNWISLSVWCHKDCIAWQLHVNQGQAISPTPGSDCSFYVSMIYTHTRNSFQSSDGKTKPLHAFWHLPRFISKQFAWQENLGSASFWIIRALLFSRSTLEQSMVDAHYFDVHRRYFWWESY